MPVRPLAHLFPRLVADRAVRGVVVTTVLLALTVPLLLRQSSAYGAGLSDGLSVGGGRGPAAVANLLALGMALAAAWLSDGVVSELRRDGSGPLLLTRPVSCRGLFLARWLAGFAALAAVVLASVTTLNAIWRATEGSGSPLSVSGAIGAAIVTWTWVGSAVLLLSSVLERGEALAGGLLVILPISLAAILPPGSVPARLSGSLPSQDVLAASRDLLAGHAVPGHALLSPLGWGCLTLAIGIFTACRREWRAAE